MHSQSPSPKPRSRGQAWFRAALVLVAAVVAGGVATSGCLDRPLCDEDCRPKTTNVFVDQIQQRAVDKIDLLLMIDNSISMADKQETLALAVPDLVNRLVNPICVNASGARVSEPATATEPCPMGASREFTPIKDIHIGIISSSLGGYGSDGLCTADPNISISPQPEQENDRGHLVAGRPRALSLGIAPGQEAPNSFLDWDLNANPNQDPNALNTQFAELVRTVGEFGCGFEASLEAWYRFLVDPAPYLDIQVAPCGGNNTNPCATPVGVDEELRAQRAAFLRGDSLVAIIMVSDENDCSIQPVNQLYYPARQNIFLPGSSSTCVSNPNDPCCYSCAVGPGPDCGQPREQDCPQQLDPSQDELNLRCWKQKERFGINFLYPVQRYVNALSRVEICPSRSDLDPESCSEATVPNPLFQDLSGGGGLTRDPSLVFLAGIVGVPYQDIQAQTDLEGMPLPADVLRFKTAQEMLNDGTWDIILGQPGASPPVAPLDPLMVESIAPRGGSNPVTGATLEPPSAGYLANPINGHEWAIPTRDDLQYSCIFPLPEGQRDCVAVKMANEAVGCDCDTQSDPQGSQNPLCQAMDGSYSNIQRFAKAYPGLRQLRVLRDYGDNSIVASICARQLSNPEAGDFGYTPAVSAIVDRLKEALTGRCLPRELTVTEEGVPCSVVEARPRRQGEPGCGGLEARRNPDPLVVEPAFKRLRELGRCGTTGTPPCDSSGWILCEINEAGEECLNVENPLSEVGWCYVDPAKGIGNPILVEDCDPTERRLLRFVDPSQQTPAKGSIVLIACLGAELDETAPAPQQPPPAEPTPTPTPDAGGTTQPPPTGDGGM